MVVNSVMMFLINEPIIIIFINTIRACDNLRCTSCDFRVIFFQDASWHPKSDYLFFRNNVPNLTRLRANLVKKKGKYYLTDDTKSSFAMCSVCLLSLMELVLVPNCSKL